MLEGIRAVVPRPHEVVCEAFPVRSPGPGQVLIKTEASAISPGTELAVYTGVHQWLSDPSRSWPKFPFVPGYSAVGRIVAAGPGVDRFREGDRVVWPGRHESYGLVDVTDRSAIWPIAASVPAPVAACAVLARFPLTALVRCPQILGQSVAVMGLGLIGQIALRLFSAAGAYPLIGVDPVEQRRVRAASGCGAATVDPAAGELPLMLRSINRGEPPDIIVDATGVPAAASLAMSAVADGGSVIMVGSPRGIAGDVDFYWDLHGRSLSLIGAHGTALGTEPREKFPFTRERAMRLIVHFLESGKLALDDILTHAVHTTELQAMYEGLLHRRDEFVGVTLHW